jgi:predicted phosphoadenosine phosphosulfate sulfurtransferase
MKLVQVYRNDLSLLDATRQRVAFIFDNYEDIHVSISGGKDSTVLAHLILTEARRRGRRVGVFFLDEEVVYQSTIDEVTYIMEEMAPEVVIPLWLQVEFRLTNATSYAENHLIAWEAGRHEIWMRPKKSYAIKYPPWDQENPIILNKNIGMTYYATLKNFESCYTDTAFCVGLRGTESMNRWRAVSKHPVEIGGQRIFWATDNGENVNFYPLYDWNFHDVWKYIYDHNLRYSKVYDWQFRRGIPVNEMRVSSLIHEKSFKSLVELPEFEPDTYNRLVKRIEGIEIAQETGKDAKMFRARKLPKNHNSWLEYRDFLIRTYPNEGDREIFVRRFSRHLQNEYVARQQCRQLILGDIGNFVPVENKPDPRQKWIDYYMEVL